MRVLRRFVCAFPFNSLDVRDSAMWLQASCSLEFHAPVATPFLLMLRPRSGAQQWVAREQYVLNPSVPAIEFTDSFGNLRQRIVAPPGPFSIHTSADIQAADFADAAPGAPFVEVQNLPDAVLPFLLPSRFCESDRFTQMAASLTAGAALGYDQCVAIVDYIRQALQYVPGTGQQIISAWEVNARNQAVCRDMAHLGIALCRALSIPARMVVGYLETLQPMDLHAWFEAYVGRRLQPQGDTSRQSGYFTNCDGRIIRRSFGPFRQRRIFGRDAPFG